MAKGEQPKSHSAQNLAKNRRSAVGGAAAAAAPDAGARRDSTLSAVEIGHSEHMPYDI